MRFGHQERDGLSGSDFANTSWANDSGDRPDGLSLTIVSTTAAGTLSAFREAVRLASQLEAQIQILVPCVVPFPLPIDRPRVAPHFRWRRLFEDCKRAEIEARIDVRLCRDARQCIYNELLLSSIILVGGRNTWWPFTPERRLVTRLKRAGYKALFVGHDAR